MGHPLDRVADHLPLAQIAERLPHGVPSEETRHRLVDGAIGAGAALLAGVALQRSGILASLTSEPAAGQRNGTGKRKSKGKHKRNGPGKS